MCPGILAFLLEFWNLCYILTGCSKMTTTLEKALATIVITFHKYSGKEGDKYKLSKSELKELLMNELPAFNSKRMDATEFQKIMSDLDHNKDNEVDFQEFTCFLACVSMGFDEFFRNCPKLPLPRK